MNEVIVTALNDGQPISTLIKDRRAKYIIECNELGNWTLTEDGKKSTINYREIEKFVDWLEERYTVTDKNGIEICSEFLLFDFLRG